MSDFAIARGITLTQGLDGETEAMACGEYLRRTWPKVGEYFVKLIKDMVQAEPGSEC